MQDWKSIRALILDMDGVLWLESQPIGDLPAAFKLIGQLGLRVILVTNNASRSLQFYLDKLRTFGIELEAWQVLSSGQALIHLLQTAYPHIRKVYLIGEAGLVEVLTQAGYLIGEQDAQAVIVSIDRGLTYEKLSSASRLVRGGAALIATNADPTIPTPGGLEPGAGAILAAVESAAGVQAAIAGKPNPQVYQLAMQRLGTSPGETLVVGDRLETDVIGAQSLGCRTALVLSGVTSAEAAQKWYPAPDLIAQDLGQLLELIKQD